MKGEHPCWHWCSSSLWLFLSGPAAPRPSRGPWKSRLLPARSGDPSRSPAPFPPRARAYALIPSSGLSSPRNRGPARSASIPCACWLMARTSLDERRPPLPKMSPLLKGRSGFLRAHPLRQGRTTLKCGLLTRRATASRTPGLLSSLLSKTGRTRRAPHASAPNHSRRTIHFTSSSTRVTLPASTAALSQSATDSG
jgi:hypothetical protein